MIRRQSESEPVRHSPEATPCDVDEEQLWSWIDRDDVRLSAHLKSCESCREAAAEVRKRIDVVKFAAGASPAPLPEHVGPYQVDCMIGMGGMAVVYKVKQPGTSREVALKVLRTSVPDSRRIRMFQREVRMLARLKHPAIASIYDAGQTNDGTHYFAMELVDGVTLGEHVRKRCFGRVERLKLFLTVSRAVQYAHQRGIIHLDLKPNNIMVTHDGEPKVLDFGLARIMDPEAADSATISTHVGIRGTFAYMSPEQISGRQDDLDVRSDVYALGVILYELLTDVSPYAFEPNWPDAVRTIQRVPPMRPSMKDRSLRGDAEAIVLKALLKEPDRRYQSVGELADDVERLIENRPVLARPPSSIESLRRWMWRHKPLTLAVLLIAATVAGFTWSLARTYKRAIDAERLAASRLSVVSEARQESEERAREFEAQSIKLRQMTGFYERLFASLESNVSPDRTDLLRSILLDIEPHLLGMAQGEVGAAIKTTVARGYLVIAEYERAQQHIRDALAILNGVKVAATEIRARALHVSGLTKEHNNRAGCAADLKSALSVLSPGLPELESLAARIRIDLAEVHVLLLDCDAAQCELLKALRYFETAPSENALQIARCNRTLANLHRVENRYDLSRQAYDRAAKLFGENGALRMLHQTLLDKFWMERAAGRIQDAGHIARQLLVMTQREFGDTPPFLAYALNTMGVHFNDVAEYERSRAYLERCHNEMRRHFPENGTLVTHAKIALAGNAWSMGDYDNAELLYRGILRQVAKNRELEHLRYGILNSLGVVLRDKGRFEESAQILHEAIAAIELHEGLDQELTLALVRNNLARMYYLAGEYRKAHDLIADVFALRNKRLGPGASATLESMLILGMTLSELGDCESARPLLQQVYDQRNRELGPTHPSVAESKSALWGCIWRLTGDLRSAEQMLNECLEVLEMRLDPEHVWIKQTEKRILEFHFHMCDSSLVKPCG